MTSPAVNLGTKRVYLPEAITLAGLGWNQEALHFVPFLVSLAPELGIASNP